MHRRVFLFFVAAAAFSVSPHFGCSMEPDFKYGERQMRAAIHGNWRITIPTDTGEAMANFGLAPGPRPADPQGLTVIQQEQCGTREFVRAANACLAKSVMYVRGRVASGTSELLNRPVRGSFLVLGLNYSGGDLNLSVGDVFAVSARINEQNDVVSFAVTNGGAPVPNATFSRLP